MTDNCPECCTGPNDPVASRTYGQQRTDTYRCPHCGHGWTTRRDKAAYTPTAAPAHQTAA
ncbi:hypothetical protein [Streptomyces sp. NPDC020983]|uniref:hypothetical protein n=1 Tax=Streptomyces sp. NPDC020983 TaxID=3365106 RepID=UPI00379E02B6